MQPLRHRINPKTFVITLRQIAKHLKIPQERILNWEKWHNVLWVHIQGLGGYFVSYRKLEQWIAACRTLMRYCPNLNILRNAGGQIISDLPTPELKAQLDHLVEGVTTHPRQSLKLRI